MQMRWYSWVILILINAAAILTGRYVRKRYQLLPADRLALIATLLTIDLFLLLRAVILDTSQCPTPVSFACLFNQNLGVLTLGVFVVAASTMYLNVRIKQSEEREANDRRKREAMMMLEASMEEISHNVQHFAHEIGDDEEFLSFPATTFEATFSLFESHTLPHLHHQLINKLRNLHRILVHNKARLTSAAEVDSSLRSVALLDQSGIVELLGVPTWLEAQNPSPLESSEEQGGNGSKVKFDEKVLTHSLRFLMEANFFHRGEIEVPRGLRSFRWLQLSLEDITKFRSYTYFHRTTEVEERDAAEYRTTGMKVFCWIKDSDIEGVEIVAIRTSFRDLAHKPH